LNRVIPSAAKDRQRTGWASVSAPTLIVDVPHGGLWVLSGSALLTTQSLPTGLSNGEIDDHLSRNFSENLENRNSLFRKTNQDLNKRFNRIVVWPR